MIDAKTAPYGAFLLRISMGILLLMHSAYLKYYLFGMGGFIKYFAKLGLPEWWAWIVPAYEVIGGLALLLGVYAYIGHGGNGWAFSAKGGGYEFPLFWAIACFVLALVGDGAYALKKSGRA